MALLTPEGFKNFRWRKPYASTSDGMFNAGLKIQIYHTPSQTEVAFKAFITDFSDQFQQSWNEEQVFGRNDPHQIFKGTKRVINIGWTILAEDIEESVENMKKLSLLAQMQYPTYNSSIQGESNVGILHANAIQASPIFRMKFLNWMQDANAASSPMDTARESGLVGKMDGFNFEPNLDAGVFHAEDGSIYPRELAISLSYTVLHTHALGWQGRNSRKKSFPYGEDLTDSSSGRSAINRETTRNDSGATIEQTEAKLKQITQSSNANLNRLSANNNQAIE